MLSTRQASYLPGKFQLPVHQRQLAHFPLLLSKNVAISGDPSKNVAISVVRMCAPLHAHYRQWQTGKRRSGRCLDDSAAPAGSWQGWPGVEEVGAQELALHAVHRDRQDLPVFIPGKAVNWLGCDVRLFKPTS